MCDIAPLVSIVMLSFNRCSDVRYGLQQIEAIAYPALEIIVVDNASKDGTREMMTHEFPKIKLIALSENIGVAAVNKGFAVAQGRYIVIIDDDSFPVPNAITNMVNAFKSDDKIGVVAFDVRNIDHYNPNCSVEMPALSAPYYHLGFNGAGAGFRKKVLEECGGYSEKFFLYWNEMDLALRIMKAGYTIFWDEKIVALHKYSPQNRASLRAPFYYTRNLFWIYWQYWPVPSLFRKMFNLLFDCFFHAIEQRNLVYIKAFFAGAMGLSSIKRDPISEQLCRFVRITDKLAYIYFK